MRQLKLWHWIILALAAFTVLRWVTTGMDPLSDISDGFRDGFRDGRR